MQGVFQNNVKQEYLPPTPHPPHDGLVGRGSRIIILLTQRITFEPLATQNMMEILIVVFKFHL